MLILDSSVGGKELKRNVNNTIALIETRIGFGIWVIQTPRKYS